MKCSMLWIESLMAVAAPSRWPRAVAIGLLAVQFAGQASAQAAVPGGCQAPDMARYANDEERHAAIRVYLLCLNEQNRNSESLVGGLPPPASQGFFGDARKPSTQPQSRGTGVGGAERYPDSRGRVLP